ncbi:MAG TPA: Bax inhibitor-1/YccA family protein [Chitinophagales bacterium]|nr:Bax inhibitor-1/YccA family protein [Chitinophagales bacterium]HRK26816.1 Bax inhibitor-1/YccA family protein [Chitinophagales bacterium]
MRTSNPALSEDTFKKAITTKGAYNANAPYAPALAEGETMTVNGTVNKSFMLLALLILSAAFSFTMPLPFFIYGGAIGGFIVAMITIFKKEWSPYTAPVYALLEGLCLGAISFLFEAEIAGIVFQAILLTVGVFASMLFVYKSGWIEVTQNFRMGLVAATGGIALIYLATLLLSFFGIQIPYIHESGLIGIGFSLFVVVIAALNLVLDFDFIEKGATYNLPRYMEWYAAFGLMVTLVWLYLEILRLLAKLNKR